MEVSIKIGKKKVDVKVCSSLWSQAWGLMFSPKKNLLFEFKRLQMVSLHMLFVFFPIWVLYLDEKKKVVDKRKLLPFVSMIWPGKKAKYVLELIDEPQVSVGDKLSW